MDFKYQPLQEKATKNPTSNLGQKVVYFSICVLFFGSLLLNVIFLTGMVPKANGLFCDENAKQKTSISEEMPPKKEIFGKFKMSSFKQYQQKKIDEILPKITKRQEIVKLAANQDCDGTSCGEDQCCRWVYNWVCCSDGFCHKTAEECPDVARKQLLAMMGVGNGCDGMNCKNGCCANLIGFYCCPKV